jgi:2-oxoglutarate ferredoxin oxidoreductase subunit gamma
VQTVEQITEPYSIRIAGIGGQGNILMGITLARALTLEKKWVVQTQSYSAQVRGGISYSDILFSNYPIDYPRTQQYDILYIMHQKSMEAFKENLRVNGILIVDQTYVSNIPRMIFAVTRKIVSLPITELAREKLNNPVVANMIGLGLLAKITGWLELENLKKAMREYVKKGHHELNEKAIELGFSLTSKKFRVRDERLKYVGRGFE